ncbi:MAG: hypothetical protein H7A23_01010 [Leptospiraceae bacterium]|nr:hypothetical protein [Leptospiraceae bacterium]MCP5493110.1 hypothetical protein [Leptospiraceae bacterium]
MIGKKSLRLILIVFIVSLSFYNCDDNKTGSEAKDKNKILGYDGIYLGNSKEQVISFIKEKYPHGKILYDQDDGTGRNNMIEVDFKRNGLKQIVYFFNEDKVLYFIGINIGHLDDANFQSLYKNMKEKYGDPILIQGRIIRWNLDNDYNISVAESNTSSVSGVVIHYKNKKLWDEYEGSLNKEKYDNF